MILWKLKLAKLDALTLRLELSDDQSVHHPLFLSSTPSPGYQQQQPKKQHCLRNDSKQTREHQFTSSIPNYLMYNITSSARTWHVCNRNISGQHTYSRRIWNHSKITFQWKLVTWSPSREGTGCALVKQRPQYVRFNVKNWNMQMSSGFSQYLQNICEISPGFNLDIPISHV